MIHILPTCKSIIREQECSQEDCKFGHDHRDIRLEMYQVRRDEAERNKALSMAEHYAAMN